MEIKDSWKATELIAATNCSATFNCSEPGSGRCGPSRRGVCSHLFYDLGKNTSKFIRAKRGCIKAALAVSKNRQPPTTFFNRQSVEPSRARACQQSRQISQGLLGV
jgi:hypothetical protein